MIEVSKILTEIYDSSVSPKLPLSSESVTRGNSFKIINRRCHYDLRKYSFCNQITNLWNSLPDVVVTAPSLIYVYDWHAEISGTGSRSNIFS